MMQFSTVLPLILGIAAAFFAAFVAVAIDMREAARATFKTPGSISVLSIWQGWMILVAWGLFDVAVYWIVLAHPDWALHTLGLKVSDDKILAGFVVGVSAIVIIRSKLVKVGSVEIGGEYAYLWSRAYVLDAISTRRALLKVQYDRKYGPIAKNLNANPNLFTEVESWIGDRAKGTNVRTQQEIEKQIKLIRKTGGSNADANPAARKALVGVAIDYFAHDFDKMAMAANYSA
jgi:hypothetical protein